MFILHNVELIETAEMQYQDASITWSFGGNSSLISLTINNKRNTNSEPWITEPSDFFSFNDEGKLTYLGLSVPGRNNELAIEAPVTMFGKLKLHNKLHSVEPTITRAFDPRNRTLTCINKQFTNEHKYSFIKLKDDINIILADSHYVGYVLSNPLNYLTDNTNDSIDSSCPADDDEYSLMRLFFEIMSDNRVEKLNDDMALVTIELSNAILPNIHFIRSSLRKKIIKSSVEELLDFYS
ncbi:hypothetical protein [Pseudomonas sp. P9_31]|uniref:hypothetical protein n=1 Tax=Pseudomonas sp. P9_31 TaxID=3043448 RepID=UPI002A3594D2|nr:hypothetical protein [Pseudomonas sp. P9_31]WPN57902.1 hypothetical protein QMK51_27995 [Pseudomonas sp. P9_31]